MRFRKGEHTCDVLCFGAAAARFFLDTLHLSESPKWGRAVIPSEYFKEEYAADILRGYFDTDGSVVITDNNGTAYPRLEMKVSPSPMQNQLIALTKMLNLGFKVYEIGKGKVRLQANGVNSLNDWVTSVGFRNEKHSKKAQLILEKK